MEEFVDRPLSRFLDAFPGKRPDHGLWDIEGCGCGEKPTLLLAERPHSPAECVVAEPDLGPDVDVVPPRLLGQFASCGGTMIFAGLETASRRHPEAVALEGVAVAKEQRSIPVIDEQNARGVSRFDHGKEAKQRRRITRL